MVGGRELIECDSCLGVTVCMVRLSVRGGLTPPFLVGDNFMEVVFSRVMHLARSRLLPSFPLRLTLDSVLFVCVCFFLPLFF